MDDFVNDLWIVDDFVDGLRIVDDLLCMICVDLKVTINARSKKIKEKKSLTNQTKMALGTLFPVGVTNRD